MADGFVCDDSINMEIYKHKQSAHSTKETELLLCSSVGLCKLIEVVVCLIIG